jgi:hypothetical protein
MKDIEQKQTKETKNRSGFVAFVAFCPNPQSAKREVRGMSVKGIMPTEEVFIPLTIIPLPSNPQSAIRNLTRQSEATAGPRSSHGSTESRPAVEENPQSAIRNPQSIHAIQFNHLAARALDANA